MNAAAMLVALAVLAGAPPPPIGYSSMTIVEHAIVRVPLPPPARGSPPVRWREAGAPACIPMAAIRGAAIAAPASVDFFLRGGGRVRAGLDSDCPALDYYSGFYLNPTGDGRICADRDSIHDRSGGECRIDRMRGLRPAGR